MKSHPVARLALSLLAILLALDAAPSPSKAMTAGAAPSSAEDLLRRMSSEAPDNCSAPAPSPSSSADINDLESRLFEAVKTLVADRLNTAPPALNSNVGLRAISALREVEQSSAENNKSWPAEDRFHFKVLDLLPAILVQMTYRSRAVLVLFGSYQAGEAPDPGTKWRQVDFSDLSFPSTDIESRDIELFPLHRGPSGRARFLARVVGGGCASSFGEDYYGYEWSPDDGQVASEIIKIEGAEGLDEAASTHVGRLSTTGKIVQLPYCFFSAVDTWDNPTLCAADSFDLSGDESLFGGRVYNRPDLVTVAKAVEYAEAHDYVAVRGYCASDTVARMLVRETPPYLFADTLDTVKTGPGREKVVLADGSVRFDLIKRRGRWQIESFKISAENP